jgi:hypothetical protein
MATLRYPDLKFDEIAKRADEIRAKREAEMSKKPAETIQQGKIPVRRKSDGARGWIWEAEFDPTIYERLAQ